MKEKIAVRRDKESPMRNRCRAFATTNCRWASLFAALVTIASAEPARGQVSPSQQLKLIITFKDSAVARSDAVKEVVLGVGPKGWWLLISGARTDPTTGVAVNRCSLTSRDRAALVDIRRAMLDLIALEGTLTVVCGETVRTRDGLAEVDLDNRQQNAPYFNLSFVRGSR